jgi:glycosyltransferase involved in cell wall biosynthesis
MRINPDRIQVIYPGVDPNFASFADALHSPPERIGGERLDSPFILAPGADDPRKNTLALVRAYGSRWGELPNEEKLVLVGMRNWRSSAVHRLVCELGLSKKVLFAGYVSEELLAWLYKSSSCFVHPTIYEGFGHPVLEAMACGTPVVTSACTSIPEVAGDAAMLVDPTSEKSIGHALVRLLQDESLRRRLIQRGRERVREFGWQNTVEKTLTVYAELTGRSSNRAMAAAMN